MNRHRQDRRIDAAIILIYIIVGAFCMLSLCALSLVVVWLWTVIA